MMIMMNNGNEVEDEDEDEYDNYDEDDDDWKVDERLNFATGDYELKCITYVLSGFASLKNQHSTQG